MNKEVTNEDILVKLDAVTSILTKRIDSIEEKLTKRIDVLETKIDTDIEKLAIMVAGGFASVDKRFDRLESTVRVHGGRIGTLEERVNILEA